MLAGTDKLVPVAGAGGVGQSTYQAWLAQPGNAGKTIGQFLAAQTGPTGPANTLTIGAVTTGSAGSQATAAITGQPPNQVLSLTIPQGAPGPANSLAVGTVTTGAAGSSAAATITGQPPNQTLNLTIPQGNAGPANTLAIGTVATGAPGSSAAASITGAAPNQSLSLTIPQGATGAQPWQTPPQPWAASTAYTATAPASSVTYGGESYVCSTTHNSGSGFDGSKWTKVAQKGADGAPAAGAVLYSQAQGLDAGSRRQARANIGALGSLYAYARYTWSASDAGGTIFIEDGAPANLPLPVLGTGESFRIYNGATSARTFTVGASHLIYAEGAYTQSFVLNPFETVEFFAYTDVGDYLVMGRGAPVRSALNADRAQTFIDSQKFQLLSNAGLLIPQCQCRLVYTSPPQITLMPEGGNQIWINGAYRTIPSGGLSGGNGGLAANTPYYVHTYMSGASPVLYVGAATPVADPTYGHKIVSGQPQFTYVGMVYTDANGQFQSAPGLVLSHYNRRDIEIVQKLASVTSSRSPAVELSTALRAYTLCHDDETVACEVKGGSTGNTGVVGLYQRLQAQITLPGGAMVLGNDAQAGGTGNTNDKRHHSSRVASKTGGNGLAYGTALGGITGSDNNYTATFDNLIVTLRTRG